MTEAPLSYFEKVPLDLGDYFLSLSRDAFEDRLRVLRKEPILKITVDVSNFDRESLIALARRLKNFLENGSKSQQRDVTVRMKREQISWEPNVFSSGVVSEYID